MLFLILAFALIGYNVNGQSFECGTQISDEEVQDLLDNRKRTTNKILKSSNVELHVAIRAHIVSDNSGNGGIPETDIDLVIDELNSNFAQANMRFTLCDINRINNSDYVSVALGSTEYNDLIVTDNSTELVNIYFIPDIHVFAGQSNHTLNFITLENNLALAFDVATHEMGHYLGLMHTFEGNNEHPKRSGDCKNCTTHGDGFCDTNADRSYNQDNSVCKNIGEICQGNTVSVMPPCNNYMSYYWDKMNKFSNQQIQTMRLHRQLERSNILGHCGNNPHANHTCSDGILNQNEIGIDCGGVCIPCHCSNGIVDENQGETNVDCGGPCLQCDQNNGNQFACTEFCLETGADFILLECSQLVAGTAGGTISPSGVEIYNSSSTSINNVNIEFTLTGAGSYVLESSTTPIGPFSLNANERIYPSLPPLSTSHVPAGLYNLEVSIIYNSSTYHTCLSTQHIDIGGTGGQGTCPEFWWLSSNDVNTSGNYNAQEEIVSSSNILVGNYVNFKAGDYIELVPGFRADSDIGTKFTSYIGPCSSGLQDGSDDKKIKKSK